MLKQLMNELSIELCLRPVGPVLIKTRAGTVSGLDDAFVQTYRNDRWEVYLPGTSLKGTIRSHAERIGRTLMGGQGVCNPFQRDGMDASCSSKLNDTAPPEAYRRSCPICKIFGSTAFTGRIGISDAYVRGDLPKPEPRDGVGIDRLTGGSFHGAKFAFEVVNSGEFVTTIRIRNFEVWQIGLLGYVIQDMCDRLVNIGSGKSRGMGDVEASVDRLTISYYGDSSVVRDGRTIAGVGALFARGKDYGYAENDTVSLENPLSFERRGARLVAETTDQKVIRSVWEASASKWRDFAKVKTGVKQ